MNYPKYMVLRLAVILAISALAIWSIMTDNNWTLIPVAIVLFFVLFAARKRVREVTADERANAVAGKASRTAFSLFIVMSAIAGILLVNLATDASDMRFYIGLTLNYAACGLLVIYWIARVYYNRKLSGRE